MSVFELFRKAGGRPRRRGSFELIRLKRPGNRLSPEAQESCLRAFAAMTDALYKADTSFHWFKHKDYFSHLSDFWTVHLHGELVGFTGTKLLSGAGEKIVYVDNMNIKPIPRRAVGRHTLGSMLVHEILASHHPGPLTPMSIVFRTQNPKVYRLADSILSRGVYPRLDGSPGRDERGRRVVSFMARTLSPDKPFDEGVSVIRGAYGRCIYGVSSDSLLKVGSDLGAFWRSHVALDEGDAVLVTVCPSFLELAATVGSYYVALWKQRLFGRARDRRT